MKKTAIALLAGLALLGSASAMANDQGKKVYKSLCFSCHDNGVAGAPKLTDKAAWEARLGQGKDALYQAVINGKGAMPARGGNPSLSDEELKAATDYMLQEAGV